MTGFTTFFAIYLVGGVTFVPLVLLSFFLLGVYTFPYREDVDDSSNGGQDDLIQPNDDMTAFEERLRAEKEGKVKGKEKDKSRVFPDADEAAGYFAVCREYTPMGINAKPIERTTPAGSTTVAAPSQSIYQTMYRGIFERKQTMSPIDSSNPVNQRPKKAGNVYYVILRHGHLMLFDDEYQTEVRFVISLLLHDISICSGGEDIPEGELFIKRNAICLSRKTDEGEAAPDWKVSKPFYLFSENCSAKEDFYFSLLRNQDQVLGGQNKSPSPLHFDTKHVIELVRKLYEVEDDKDMRWLNALLGRMFLSVYKTNDIKQLIIEKITKKISRIKRPSFLTHIVVRNIDLGDSAPVISNPRLKNLTVQGECVTEANIRYTGNFRIEIATTAKVDIGHFTKEVSLVLAVVLKKLEGHILFKIKPPPSNRIWVSFSHMPKLEMAIEPIVSSRQITWNIILNQIESRIREVFAESMVFPFWDDTPFFDTEHKKWRGGIWEDDEAVSLPSDLEAEVAQQGDVDEVEKLDQAEVEDEIPRLKEKSLTAPPSETLASSSSSSLFSRKLNGKSFLSTRSNGSSTSVEPKSPISSSTKVPKPGLFRSSPIPIIDTDNTDADVLKSATPLEPMATMSIKANLHETGSAVATLSPSPTHPYFLKRASSIQSVSSKEIDLDENALGPTRTDTNMTTSTTGTSSGESISSVSSKFSIRPQGTASPMTRGFFSRKDDSQASLVNTGAGASSSAGTGDGKKGTTLSTVSNAARSWGLNALKRGENKNQDGNDQQQQQQQQQQYQIDLTQPMGRGQPLPPPGMPLPMPNRKTPTAPIPTRKRSILPLPPIAPDEERRDMDKYRRHDSGMATGEKKPCSSDIRASYSTESSHDDNRAGKHTTPRRPVPLPPLPRRRLVSHSQEEGSLQDRDDILVVAAPEASEPTTPMSPDHPVFQKSWADDGLIKDVDSGGDIPTPRSVPDLGLGSLRQGPTYDSRSMGNYGIGGPGNRLDSAVKIDNDDEFSGWMNNQDFDCLNTETPSGDTSADTQSASLQAENKAYTVS